jgi:hypothetical protein
MAREPADRYATAADLRAALLAAGASSSTDTDLTATTATPATTASPRPPAGAPATTSAQPTPPTFRQSERDLFIPTVLVVVVAVALGVAGLLLSRSGAFDGVRDALGGSKHASQVQVQSAQPFDPGGNPPGQENNNSAPLAIDGNASTGWRTEGYNDRDITKLKPGVGLILHLASTADLQELQLDSPTNDWKVEIYVADGSPASLAAWGSPVATKTLPKGSNKIGLKGTKGNAVLIWILDRGDGAGRASAEIDEARVTGS